MTSFSRHTIAGTEPLGEKLRRLREDEGVSLEEFAHRSGIQAKYVKALEAGQYDQLPGEAYVRNFLRKYAEEFHVDADRLSSFYRQERTLVHAVGPSAKPPGVVPETQALDLHRILKILGVVGILAALAVYLGITVYRVVTPPTLALTAPSKDIVTHELSLTVSGIAEKESHVQINGQEIVTDPTGHFSERIDLQPGLNVIKVSAKKQRSHEQVLYRQVIVETTPEGGQ